MTEFDTRVGAYGVIVRQERILLAHFSLSAKDNGWTLPGGGLEFGEDGPTGAVREIREETGFDVRLGGLLGVDSVHLDDSERPRPLHALRLIYRAEIVGGQMAVEVGGSTDDVGWFELERVAQLDRVPLVDVAMELWRER